MPLTSTHRNEGRAARESRVRGAFDFWRGSKPAWRRPRHSGRSGSILDSCAKPLLAVALALSLGLHWGVLQSVAWVSMLANYSRNASFAEACSKTFDGLHPCQLCTAIHNGRAEENQNDTQRGPSGPKLEPAVVWQATDFNFSRDREKVSLPVLELISRSDPPSKPRPRGAVSSNLA